MRNLTRVPVKHLALEDSMSSAALPPETLVSPVSTSADQTKLAATRKQPPKYRPPKTYAERIFRLLVNSKCCALKIWVTRLWSSNLV